MYDPNYELRINSLIPLAEKEAKEKVEKLGVKTKSVAGKNGEIFEYDYWTEFFHEAMNRLSIEAKLRYC